MDENENAELEIVLALLVDQRLLAVMRLANLVFPGMDVDSMIRELEHLKPLVNGPNLG